jgi:ankyrin repeat protein
MEMTALHLAAKKRHTKAVKMLLAAGVNVMAQDENERTAVEFLSQSDPVVEILLNAGEI